MVGFGALQGAETVIDTAIEVQDPGVGFQQFYCRQESAALQAFPVEAARRNVGCGDQGHPPLEERSEQAPQQHRVRDIAHLELVEAHDPGIRRQAVSHQTEGVSMRAESLELAVDVLHEGVEVHPQLRRERQRFEKIIHYQGLASTDATPQVHAPHRLQTPGAKKAEPATPTFTDRGRAAQALEEILESFDRVHLRRVATQLPPFDLPHVALSRRNRALRGSAGAGPDGDGTSSRFPAVASPRIHFSFSCRAPAQ